MHQSSKRSNASHCLTRATISGVQRESSSRCPTPPQPGPCPALLAWGRGQASAPSGNVDNRLGELVGVPRAFGGHFGASGLLGQYFDFVEIQTLASASVSKSPICESGPFPVLTATNQRPLLVISAWNEGTGFVMPLICNAVCQHSTPFRLPQSN